MIKPILIFGYGNLSRGDDSLGILLLNYIEQHFNLESIEILSDFQLQIEHALDLENRDLVLFIDASVADINVYAFQQLIAQKDKSYSTHAMSPSSVLAVYQAIKKQTPPPCFLLSIKGESFELGESLSANAQNYLASAMQFTDKLLNNAELKIWQSLQC